MATTSPINTSVPKSNETKHAPRFIDIDTLSWHDWTNIASGHKQWDSFKASTTTVSRDRLRRLALGHWNTLSDFQWVEENIPNLEELDLSDIQDLYIYEGVEVPSPTCSKAKEVDANEAKELSTKGWYTWTELVAACPRLWPRIRKLWVRHWGCSVLQDPYSRGHLPEIGGTREKDTMHPTTITRREGGADVTAVVKECTRLQVLAVRGPWTTETRLSHSVAWQGSRWCIDQEGGHGHVCALVRGLIASVPGTITKLELHQGEFIPRMVDMLENTPIKRVEIAFGDILRRYNLHEVSLSPDKAHEITDLYDKGQCPYSNKHGPPKHRDIDADVRNQSKGVSFNEFLVALWATGRTSPIKLGVHDKDTLNSVPVSFFAGDSFIRSVDLKRPAKLYTSKGIFNLEDEEGYNAALSAFRWLYTTFQWAPLWDWDPFISPSFPANLDIDANKADNLVACIRGGLQAIKDNGIPVRLLIGHHHSTCSTPALSHTHTGYLLWGWLSPTDWKGWKTGRWSAHLESAGPLVEALAIQYDDNAGISTGLPTSHEQRENPGITNALRREARGWQHFWHRYALHFTGLRRLDIRMPECCDKWDSKRLGRLLNLEHGWMWRKLRDEKGSATNFVCRVWERATLGDLVFSRKDVEDTEEVFEDSGSEEDLQDVSEDVDTWRPSTPGHSSMYTEIDLSTPPPEGRSESDNANTKIDLVTPPALRQEESSYVHEEIDLTTPPEVETSHQDATFITIDDREELRDTVSVKKDSTVETEQEIWEISDDEEEPVEALGFSTIISEEIVPVPPQKSPLGFNTIASMSVSPTGLYASSSFTELDDTSIIDVSEIVTTSRSQRLLCRETAPCARSEPSEGQVSTALPDVTAGLDATAAATPVTAPEENGADGSIIAEPNPPKTDKRRMRKRARAQARLQRNQTKKGDGEEPTPKKQKISRKEKELAELQATADAIGATTGRRARGRGK